MLVALKRWPLDSFGSLLRRILLSKGPPGTGILALIAALVAVFQLRQHIRRKLNPGDRNNRYHGWLRMSSPLQGSTVKYQRPSIRKGTDECTWLGHCPCCKRPVELTPSERPAYKRLLASARGKFAYVITLWGSSPAYVLGAIVLGHSIKRTKTPHALVCIHTPDVPKDLVALLSFNWDCRLVEHIASTKALTTWKEPNRFDCVFTKLHCLSLVEFEKVLVMDIDLLVTANVDNLFQLSTPAALRRGMNDGKWPLKHGDWIDGRAFFGGACKGEASWGQATGINAGVMLLQPDAEVLREMLEEIRDPKHPSHIEGNGPEQDYLSRYWADAPWSQISPEYNFQLHQMFYALQPDVVHGAERNRLLSNPTDIKIIHFSGEGIGKPWCRIQDDRWPDRSFDAAYTQVVAESFRGYWLWIKRDRQYWDSVKYARDTDGLELGDDGQLYRCPKYWERSNPVASEEREVVEIPSWAAEGAMNVLDGSLRMWMKACEELEALMGVNFREVFRKPPAVAMDVPCSETSK